MKQKIFKLILLSFLIFLASCNNNSSSEDKKDITSTDINSTELSSNVGSQQSTEKNTEQSVETTTSEPAVSTSSNESHGSTTYQNILDEYTTKIQSATPGLIQEFKNESVNNTSGIDGLAAISNNKVERLAIISNEGISKMSDLHYLLSDDYSTYESWATKLTDVYTTESQKIIGEYLAYFSNQENKPITSSASPQDSELADPVNQETPSETTTVVQSGEGPRQIAERAGITVDQLFSLNGMDPNNYLLYPGQELRVK